MTYKFEQIKADYHAKFEEFGVSSAAMLMPKGRHDARFSVVAEHLRKLNNPTLLDYGCGLGFLHDYLNEQKVSNRYFGVDMTRSFIESSRARVGSSARFEVIDPEEVLTEEFDVVYASGVFNLQSAKSEADSLAYVRKRLVNLLDISKKLLIVDFLSPDVDFEQEGSQHIDYRLVLDWLVPSFSRRWVVRHDYLPYEYTIIIFKDDQTEKPLNIFLNQY